MAKILITGLAGFIGYHLALKLNEKHRVFGLDFLSNDNVMGHYRLQQLQAKMPDFNYTQIDIEQYENLKTYLQKIQPDIIIHLAAKTGISASQENPHIYFNSNVSGFYHILEGARITGVKQIIYATSSSVYQSGQSAIFEESHAENQQLSFYGATKRLNEVMAQNYARQFGIQLLGLRFFTVYGSWVRTDMAAWKFMEAIRLNQPVTLYNQGEVFRDFTHVSDIVQAIYLLVQKIQSPHYEMLHSIMNIGNGSPVKVSEYLQAIAHHLEKTARVIFKELPANELPSTHADTKKLESFIGFKPNTDIYLGTKEMTDWYKKLF